MVEPRLRYGRIGTPSGVVLEDEFRVGVLRVAGGAAVAPFIDRGGATFNVRAFGVKGDGITEETLAIQAVLDMASAVHGTVVFPGGVYLVAPLQQVPVRTWRTCLNIPSNISIRFEGGARIKMIPVVWGRYSIFSLADVENVRMEYPVLEGDRYEHTGDYDEQGHCFQFLGARNVTLVRPEAYYGWGDGFYFGTTATAPLGRPNENVTLIHPLAKQNGRNGVSITSGRHLTIDHLTAIDNNRTPPCAGIDIEPNWPEDVIDDVRIITPYTKGGERGVMIALQKSHQGGTVVVTQPRIKDVDLIGLITSAGQQNFSVFVDEPEIENCGELAIHAGHWTHDSKLFIRDPVIRRANLTAGDHAIFVGNENTREGVVGDIRITGIDLVSPDSQHAIRMAEVAGPIGEYGPPHNIDYDFVRCEVAGPPLVFGAVASQARVRTSDPEVLLYRRPAGMPAAVNIQNSTGFYTAYQNAPDVRNGFNLPISNRVEGVAFTFFASEFGDMFVRPNANEAIRWKGAGNGKYIRCQEAEGKLVLRSIGTGWRVEEIVGEWTVEP